MASLHSKKKSVRSSAAPLKCLHAVKVIADSARDLSRHPLRDNKPAVDAMRECPAAEGQARSLLLKSGEARSASNVAKIKRFDPGGG